MARGSSRRPFGRVLMPRPNMRVQRTRRLASLGRSRCWLGSVVVLIAGPVLLVRGSVVPRPIRSAAPGLAAVAVLVVYCIGVFGFDWPRWPEVLNSDLEVVGVTYFVSAVVSSVSLF